MKTDNAKIPPRSIIEPLKKGESEIIGNKVIAQKAIKTIFAATIDTTKDIEIRNMLFEFKLFST